MNSGNSYVVPATVAQGAITSWSHSAYNGAGQQITMKVWRLVAGNIYRVVGHDGPRTPDAGVVNTYSGFSIPVQPGDVLGLNAGSAASACLFSAPAEVFGLASGSNAADGDTATFTFSPSNNFRTNATAVLTPSNTFTLGAITRNKKKGTATLTFDVPNPGELTGSGKGVKVASAAVISKKVTAPGKVKLTIRAKGKKKATLNETGKVKVKPKITYTPTGGDPRTQSIKVKLKKKL